MNNRQITKIDIRGFKSIKECSIDLKMLNVMIGCNGSGKSNFISLLDMLQSMIEGELQSYVSKNGGPNAILHFGRKETEKLQVEFYFGNNGYQFSLVPTADDRVMFDGEWFYWNQSGKHSLGNGHFESKWEIGCGNLIDSYVRPILRNQRWRVFHFHDTSESAKVKQIHGINDNEELARDARNLAAFLFMLKNAASPPP